jgi:hypothetical protein
LPDTSARHHNQSELADGYFNSDLHRRYDRADNIEHFGIG